MYLSGDIMTANPEKQIPVIIAGGLGMGIVAGLWHNLIMAEPHGTSIINVVKNSARHMIEQGIGGIIIALTYVKVHPNVY